MDQEDRVYNFLKTQSVDDSSCTRGCALIINPIKHTPFLMMLPAWEDSFTHF